MMRRQLWVAAAAAVVGATLVLGEKLTTSSSNGSPPSFLPGRRLEDVTTFEYNDLSQFSLRFEKCQYVQTYEDEFAEDEDNDSPLAMKHFVVYRLCPTGSCETCDEQYGTYVIDAESYLSYTIDYQTQAFEEMCNNCNQKCNNEGSYCSGCGKLCYQYNNLEANGYIDASQYYYCQQLNYGDDDSSTTYYIGPRCSSQGQKITIGLFSDQNCWEPIDDVDPKDILGANLSYHLLSQASVDDGSVCLSCHEQGNEQDNEQDQADADDVNQMCEDLYYMSAKCESKTGLEGGFIQTNRQDQDYENQVENEFMSCTFIDSLLYNSYTETGEIDIYSPQDEIIRQTTPLQSLMLAMLSLTIVGLLASAAFLHRKIGESATFSLQRPDSQLV